MTASLDELQARAEAHNDEIESDAWFTVADLAERWRLSETTVRAIPLDELHYKEFGAGKKHKRRRYRGDWIAAYEDQRSDA